MAQKLADAFWPCELADALRRRDTAAIMATAGLNPDQADKVVASLFNSPLLFDLATVELLDLPRIELKDGDRYKDSLSLSTVLPKIHSADTMGFPSGVSHGAARNRLRSGSLAAHGPRRRGSVGTLLRSISRATRQTRWRRDSEMNPATQLAKSLWSEGMAMTPELFSRSIRRIYRAGITWRARWFVGGALADYLLLHPSAVRAPAGLVERLCASRHVHSRIVGVKLLFRSVDDIGGHLELIQLAFHDKSPEVRTTVVYEIIRLYREPSALRDPLAWSAGIGEGMSAAAKDRENLNWKNARSYLAHWRACGFDMKGQTKRLERNRSESTRKRISARAVR